MWLFWKIINSSWYYIGHYSKFNFNRCQILWRIQINMSHTILHEKIRKILWKWFSKDFLEFSGILRGCIKTFHESHNDFKFDSFGKSFTYYHHLNKHIKTIHESYKDHKCDFWENHSLKMVIREYTSKWFMMDSKIIQPHTAPRYSPTPCQVML